MSAVAIIVVVLVLILVVGGFFFYRGYMVGTTQEHTANGLKIVVGKKWFSDYTLKIDDDDIDFTNETPETINNQTAVYSDNSVTFGKITVDFTPSTGVVDITIVGETATTTTTLNSVSGQFVGKSSNIYNYELKRNVLKIEGSKITFAKSATTDPEAAAVAGSPTTIKGEAVTYTADSNVLTVDGVTVTYDTANNMIKVETEQIATTTPVSDPVVNTNVTFTTGDNHVINASFTDGEFGELTVTDNTTGNASNVNTTIPADLTFVGGEYYIVDDPVGNKLIFKGGGQELYILNVTDLNISKYTTPTTLTSTSCSFNDVLYNYLNGNSIYPKLVDTFKFDNDKCVVSKEFIYDNGTDDPIGVNVINGSLEAVYLKPLGGGPTTPITKYTSDVMISSDVWYYYHEINSNTVVVLREKDVRGTPQTEAFSVDISDSSSSASTIVIPSTTPTDGDSCGYPMAVVDYILGGGSGTTPDPTASTFTYNGGKCIEDTSAGP